MTPLETIRSAMRATPPVTVTVLYVDRKNQATEREVEPYEIKNGELFCHCLKTQREGKDPCTRRLKLEQIHEARVGVKFTPRYPVVVPA